VQKQIENSQIVLELRCTLLHTCPKRDISIIFVVDIIRNINDNNMVTTGNKFLAAW